MLWFYRVAALLLVLSLWPGSSSADPIRFYYISDSRPLSWQDDEGHARGTYIDVLDAVAAQAGIKFEYHSFPWPRAQSMVQHGELDGFLTIDTEERDKYARFAPTPVISVRQRIYHRADDHRFDHVTDPLQLAGYRQLTLIGGGTGQIYDPNRQTAVRSLDDMARMLANGRGDYFISDPLIMQSAFANTDLKPRIATSEAPFLLTLEFRIGLRKDYPGVDTILRRLDEEIQTAHRSGQIERILEAGGR
jgi:polar amino acid transport system substrate-binding protein